MFFAVLKMAVSKKGKKVSLEGFMQKQNDTLMKKLHCNNFYFIKFYFEQE